MAHLVVYIAYVNNIYNLFISIIKPKTLNIFVVKFCNNNNNNNNNNKIKELIKI